MAARLLGIVLSLLLRGACEDAWTTAALSENIDGGAVGPVALEKRRWTVESLGISSSDPCQAIALADPLGTAGFFRGR
jgi:hypothetical protein